jgi:signal transduction histidine kinase/CheY-like chemotaxis protein
VTSSKLRLRLRLTALGLLAAVPALVIIVYSQRLARVRALESVTENLQDITRVAAAEQAVVFDGMQRLLLTLSQFPSLRDAKPDACQALLPGVLRDHPGYIDIWVVLADGSPFCGAAPSRATAADNIARTWFTRATSGTRMVASDVQVSIINGKPDIVIARPLVSPSGRMDHLLAASIALTQLTAIASRAQLPAGASLTVFDQAGAVVARVPNDDLVGRRITDDMRPPAGGGDDTVRTIAGLSGQVKLYTTAKIGTSLDTGLETGLVVGIGIDRDAAFAASDTLATRQRLLLVVVILAGALTTLLCGEFFVVRPISSMAGATRRLAAGDFSARARLRAGMPGLADVAAAVNDMASELEIRDAERRVAEAALRTSEDQHRHAQKLEAIGQLAAGIAHNFNNLLTVIVGFTQLLLMRHTSASADRDDLLEVDKAARRGAELTRQLLTFSRRHEAQPRTLDLNASISAMRDMLGRVLRENICLTIDLTPEPALIVIDPQELEQILVNLVLNARDAQPHGGSIHVACGVTDIGGAGQPHEIQAAAGRYVRLRVTDTGTGMTAAVLKHLFEPFFTTKEVGEGTGLGLAAVDGIVRNNHGVVTVESTVGKGSTFTVYFPAAGQPVAHAAQRPAAPAAAAGSKNATILLVEDEAPVRAIVVRTLERAGYRVLSAGTPSRAWDIFEQHGNDIALVVSDVVMPEMSGPKLVERLVARRPGVRVLFISGYSEGKLSGLPAGARLLKKPFAPSALAAAVADALS